jgi:hypothetical protein
VCRLRVFAKAVLAFGVLHFDMKLLGGLIYSLMPLLPAVAAVGLDRRVSQRNDVASCVVHGCAWSTPDWRVRVLQWGPAGLSAELQGHIGREIAMDGGAQGLAQG